MKRQLGMLLVFTLIMQYVFSQNVGIGTDKPTERLDVRGNINVTGDIKFNNSSGAPGQVLGRTSDNSLSWMNVGNNYRNNSVKRNSGAGTFTVPAGVSQIFVEIWGAGGGGSIEGDAKNEWRYLVGGAGGGGGGYLHALLNVTPGQIINFFVGKGGVKYANPLSNPTSIAYLGRNGDSSFVSFNSNKLIAEGGKGVSMASTGIWTSVGSGGGFSATIANDKVAFYYGINGESGDFPGNTTHMVGSQYSPNFDYGNGGNSGNSLNTKGIGSKMREAYIFGNRGQTFGLPIPPKQPGGGGAGAGSDFLQGGSYDIFEINGANGMVIFWW